MGHKPRWELGAGGREGPCPPRSSRRGPGVHAWGGVSLADRSGQQDRGSRRVEKWHGTDPEAQALSGVS